MDRNENLHPLDWDHHYGLVVAQQLAGCEEEEDSQEVQDLKSKFLKQWHNHLKKHFRQEEDYLLPMIEVEVSNHPKNIRVLKEHIHIKSLVYKLENELEALPGLLREIGNTLQAHIKFEERQFFPEVEQLLNKEQLWYVGKLLYQEYEKWE